MGPTCRGKLLLNGLISCQNFMEVTSRCPEPIFIPVFLWLSNYEHILHNMGKHQPSVAPRQKSWGYLGDFSAVATRPHLEPCRFAGG